MKSKLIPVLVMGSVILACASGCSLFQNRDAKFARQVIDAVYSGRLDSIQDSLAPEMQQPFAGIAVAQAGPLLRQQYGEVQSLELKSSEPAQGAPTMTRKIWTVTAERGTFELTLVVNKEHKLAGVWAQPPSGQ